jgi:thymidylate synthase
MNNLDKQYQRLLQDIIDYGVEKTDRTGTGTKSIFGYTIRHNMKEGFPLLTTKKMAWKSIVTELLWFLRGDTNIKFLVDNGCHIWDGDAYKNYLKNSSTSLDGMYLSKEEFIHHVKNNETWGKKWGELGPIYGKQWRKWQGWMDLNDDDRRGSIWYDQIQTLIHQLKTNPDSRRLMVSAWNVAELDEMVLPPCHYGFQVYTRELSIEERVAEYEKRGYIKNIDPLDYAPSRAISLMWNQRSVDTFLGLPFNIASYGLLLSLIAKEVNMVPDQLIGNLGDVHLYSNHIEQAKQQIGRELGYEERYHIWFANNYETGFEYNEKEKVDFDNPYWTPTPKSTREPYPLPEISLNFEYQYQEGYKILWDKINVSEIELINYKSHPPIKAPLSN